MQNTTYLKKKTTPDDRLVSLSKKYAQRVQLASAFDKLIGDGSDDAVAIKLLAAFHSPSTGDDTASSPAYEPPDGLSPLATLRCGPAGGATLIELATSLIADPLDAQARRAFLRGHSEQLAVTKRLYLASGDGGFTDLKRFVVSDPFSLRDRLLEVYGIMSKAMAVVDSSAAARLAGFRQPELDDQVDGQAPVQEAPNMQEQISVADIMKLVDKSITDKLIEVITPLSESLDNDRQQVTRGFEELAYQSKLLDAKLQETMAVPTTSSVKQEPPASPEVKVKLEAPPDGQSDAQARLANEVGELRRENAKLAADVHSIAKGVASSRPSTPSYKQSLGPRREATSWAADMPPMPEWTRVPMPPGLENTKPPNYAGAWLSRPVEGERGKPARKELMTTLSQEKLLASLPSAGDAIAYGVVRGSMLESFFMYSEYLHGGGERGEVALLRALHAGASSRYQQYDTTEAHWRSLMTAVTVYAFIEELDSVYADHNHTASEDEWESAKKSAKDALDLFNRLRHLLTSDHALKRCRSELSKYLAARNESHTMSELMKCELHDLAAWHKVLDTLRSVKKQMDAVAPAAEPRRKAAAFEQAATGQAIAGLNRVSDSHLETNYSGGFLSAEADMTLSESTALLKALKELRDKQKEQEAAQREVQRKLAAVESSRGHQLAAFDTSRSGNGFGGGGFRSSEPPMVYDLKAIKEFCGIDKPVPERRGPHENGTHGEECFVCSALGYQFDTHDVLKNKGFPTGWRSYHNAWKCTKIPKFVEMKAQEKGATREEVQKVLTPIPDPTWRPRGV